MWWVIGLAIYVLLLLGGVMFLRGGSIREYSPPGASANAPASLHGYHQRRFRRWRWDRHAAAGGGRG